MLGEVCNSAQHRDDDYFYHKILFMNSLYLQSFKNVEFEQGVLARVKRASQALASKIKAFQISAIDIVFKQDDLYQFAELAKDTVDYEKVLVLGVGGSSLGGKTLSSLKLHHKLEFIESIDPKTLKNCLDLLNFEKTFFLVISKSGETIETICQTLIIIDKIKELKINNFAGQFLFVTESQDNSLAKIAKKINAKIVSHPNIGGRFSCFSIVGLLPALIAGLDISKIRQGATKVVEDFLQDENAIINSAAVQLNLFQKGVTSNVIMPYIDNLKNFTDWYRQLWAESLGKDGFGSVPINSMGTIDQHSQLQLYLDGPRDKFFTFITAKNHDCDFAIKDLSGCNTLFGGKNLSEVVRVEQETTIEVLNRKKLPIRIFAIESLNEQVLGGLMMQMFLETMLIADVYDINPFGQPAVELRKDLAKEILSKNE